MIYTIDGHLYRPLKPARKMQLRHIVFFSVSVVAVFCTLDFFFLKYSYVLRTTNSELIRYAAAMEETMEARNASTPMIRLENTEAVLREIVDSHREGERHMDNELKFYQYKLGLENRYWDNKMIANVAMEKTARLNRDQVDQSDKALVEVVGRYWLHPPSTEPYSLTNPRLEDFSMGQSSIVDTLLNGLKGGFFVECGAMDGETRSNTLFFEREREWEGLLIEAGPGNYRQLLNKHRFAWSSPSCLAIDQHPSSMLFHKGRNRGRLLNSGDAFDWVSEQHMSLSVTTVQCFPLFTYLLALNVTHVDYLSLDVEGLELQVLQTIPWDELTISVLTVEFTHGSEGRSGLEDYMSLQGYVRIAEITRDDRLANDLVFIPQS